MPGRGCCAASSTHDATTQTSPADSRNERMKLVALFAKGALRRLPVRSPWYRSYVVITSASVVLHDARATPLPRRATLRLRAHTGHHERYQDEGNSG